MLIMRSLMLRQHDADAGADARARDLKSPRQPVVFDDAVSLQKVGQRFQIVVDRAVRRDANVDFIPAVDAASALHHKAPSGFLDPDEIGRCLGAAVSGRRA